MEDQALAGAQKKAAREGRIIIFIDESGISERPHRVSTWAPKGQTPVLQYSFTWKQLSAVAGISFWNIYFKLVRGAVGRLVSLRSPTRCATRSWLQVG